MHGQAPTSYTQTEPTLSYQLLNLLPAVESPCGAYTKQSQDIWILHCLMQSLFCREQIRNPLRAEGSANHCQSQQALPNSQLLLQTWRLFQFGSMAGPLQKQFLQDSGGGHICSRQGWSAVSSLNQWSTASAHVCTEHCIVFVVHQMTTVPMYGHSSTFSPPICIIKLINIHKDPRQTAMAPVAVTYSQRSNSHDAELCSSGMPPC